MPENILSFQVLVSRHKKLILSPARKKMTSPQEEPIAWGLYSSFCSGTSLMLYASGAADRRFMHLCFVRSTREFTDYNQPCLRASQPVAVGKRIPPFLRSSLSDGAIVLLLVVCTGAPRHGRYGRYGRLVIQSRAVRSRSCQSRAFARTRSYMHNIIDHHSDHCYQRLKITSRNMRNAGTSANPPHTTDMHKGPTEAHHATPAPYLCEYTQPWGVPDSLW